MRKKLIITEAQYAKLEKFLTESTAMSSMVQAMRKEMDENYTLDTNYVQEGGDYDHVHMFKVNVSEELINAEALRDYLQYKFKTPEEFTEQVIRDWASGTITEEGGLSKIVPFK